MIPADFKKFITSRFFFVLSVQIQSVVLGWQMYVLTQSAFCLGFIGLVEATPAIGLALYAGYLVDRRRPLPIYRTVVCVNFVSAALMLVAQYPGLGLSLNAHVLTLFVSSFLTGTSRAFLQPSMYAIVPRIVPRELLPKTAALSSSSMQIARVAGPAVGGILFGWLGISPSAAIVCFLLVVSFSVTLLMRQSPEPAERATAGGKVKGTSFNHELLVGVRYVFKHPILLPALTLDMVSVLLGGVTALLPLYAAEILHVGPEGLGWLRGAPAIGALIMSFRLARSPVQQNAGKWLFTAVTGFGASIIVFALSQNMALSIIVLALSGGFDSVSAVIRSTAVQLSSPDSMRGRISAVNSIFIGSSNELGEFESGIAAGLIGTVPAAVFGGIACLCTALVIAKLFPQLYKLDLNSLKVIES